MTGTLVPLRQRCPVLLLTAFLCLLALGLASRAEGAADTGGDTGFEVCTVAASCQAGAFGELGGELAFPSGVAADPAGNVYVAEVDRIQKFDSSGNWERAWGRDVVAGGGTGFEVCTVAPSCKGGATGQLGGELFFPVRVAADAAGKVYVADGFNNRIQKYDSAGNWERAWGGDVVHNGDTGFEVCTMAISCQGGISVLTMGGFLSYPAWVGADPAGKVYVVDHNRIQKFDASGNWERAWGKDVVPRLIGPPDTSTGFEICTVAVICGPGAFGDLGGEFSGAAGVAAGAAGKVYVADQGNLRIQKFDSSGNWERAWGKDVVATPPAPPPPPPAPSATCRGKQATIVGTGGADQITGTPAADVIVGLGGKDKLSGLAGKDVICGGKGNDTLKGGAGNDQLSGQKGDDKLYGQKGNDKLSGKGGKDILKGGPGKDTLKGGAGKDKQVQ